MCGIFGCILAKGNAAPHLLEGLKRLEYRGYDSAGEATIDHGEITVKKASGRIAQINQKIHLDKAPGSIGIAHTRWATHGAPTSENAHPHTDCGGEVAVIHNGIIENFASLRKNLEEGGHKFKSRTDTEVLPHLIEEQLGKGETLTEALRLSLLEVKGSYAVAAISKKEPDKIVCARRGSPLLIGVGNPSLYFASDIPALLPFTKNIVILEDGQMAVLELGKLKVLRIKSGKKIRYQTQEVDILLGVAEKGGYPHFMLKEIHEQPTSLRNTLLPIHDPYISKMAEILSGGEKIFLVASGTSYHACVAASYVFSEVARLSPIPVISSEFVENYGQVPDKATVVVTVSQSGETADTLNAIKYAKKRGAKILGVTNVLGSSLTRLCDLYVNQNSGPEIGVAATKTFTAQVLILIKIAIRTAELKRVLGAGRVRGLLRSLEKTPDLAAQVLDRTEARIEKLAEKYLDSNSFCFLGRGLNYATALEGRLKLLEISYTPALAYPAGESKHGFISVIHEGYPVIFIAPNDYTRPKILGNIMEMKARKADVIALIEEGDLELEELVDEAVALPPLPTHLLEPILYMIPLQLFSYYVAVKRGLDPDKPRSLAKSVTVE